MLLSILILVPILLNLVVFVAFVRSQRITAGGCGGCGAPVSAGTSSNCPGCGQDRLEVGIAAGSVMRPVSRRILVATAAVVTLSTLPIMVTWVDGAITAWEAGGEWRNATEVRLSLPDVRDEPTKAVVLRTEIISESEKGATVEAWFDLEVQVDGERVGDPWRHMILSRGNSIPDIEHEVPFATEDAQRWLEESGILEGSKPWHLEYGAKCLHENAEFMVEAFGAPLMNTVSTTPFNNTRTLEYDESVPAPRYLLVMAWTCFAILFGLAILLVIRLVLRLSGGPGEAVG